MSQILLSVQNLKIVFQNNQSITEAVKGISFNLKKNHIVAIVGESGSGKSVTALSLTQLLPSNSKCIVTGSIVYKEHNLLTLNSHQLRKIRGKEIAYIFQEPASSLNPVLTIGYHIGEAIRLHQPSIKNIEERTIQYLQDVGIQFPEKRIHAYPHELSGGMQRRVMIAIALACTPTLLIADEPTTALDVTIQKQILDLLKSLQKKYSMTILLITHNFGIVSNFANDIIVMHQGQIVETGPTTTLLQNPQHPYTQALLACIPQIGKQQKRLQTIEYTSL